MKGPGAGWYWHDSMHDAPSGAPASGHVGGVGKQTPDGSTPLTQLASVVAPPASEWGTTEYWQYSPALQPVESKQVAPGWTHVLKEHTRPLAQQVAPHAACDAQHAPPAQTPPSPHACPSMQDASPPWGPVSPLESMLDSWLPVSRTRESPTVASRLLASCPPSGVN
jgi:hypothetical protein